MRLRVMRPQDAEVVAALELRIFDEGWTASVYQRELETNKLARYWLIELGGDLAGFCGVWCVVDEAQVTTIGVLPALRGQGCGELLFQALLRHARWHRQRSVTLEVRVLNLAARGLYQSYGFAEVGRRRAYYSDNGDDALTMRLDGVQSRAFGRRLDQRLRRLRDRFNPQIQETA